MKIRSIASMGAWAVCDQLLSSGTNFAVAILVARTLGPAGYGSFALAFGGWLLIMGFARALITQPYMVTASGLPDTPWRDATSSAAAAQLGFGLVAGTVLVVAGLVLGIGGPTGGALVAVGVFAGPLVVQDFWRFAAFSQQMPRRAAANDAVWAIAEAVTLGVLIGTDALTPATAMTAWGIGGFAGALYGIWQFRVSPTFRRTTRAWIRRNAALGGWIALANGTYQIGSYSVVIALGIGFGRSALGGLRSTMNLFAPAQLLATSGEAIFLPKAVGMVRDGRRKDLQLACIAYSLSLAACFAAAGVILLSLGPTIYRLVFGKEFVQYATLVAPLLAHTVASGLASGSDVGIRSLAAGRKLAGIQAVAASTKAILVVACLPLGLTAAAWGIAVSELGRAALGWTLFRKALRRSPPTDDKAIPKPVLGPIDNQIVE